MPAAIPAAVTAAGTLGGAVLASRSNSKANKTQAVANAEAIAMAKDNEARRRLEYDRAEALSKAQWDAEQARLEPYRAAQNALLGQTSNRLGLSLGQIAGARQAAPYPGTGGLAANTQPRTMQQLAGYEAGYTPEVQAAPKLTIADIGNWGSPRRMS